MREVFKVCQQIRTDASDPKGRKPSKKCPGGYSIPSDHTCGGKKDVKAPKQEKCGKEGCKISSQPEYRASRLLSTLPPSPHPITFTPKLGGVVAYKTAKGSTYVVGSHEGRPSSMRYKTPHEYHDPNDKGWKKPADLTVYVDPQTAKEIGMWSSSSARGKRIAVSPETGVMLLSDNPLSGQKGRDRLISSGAFSTTPQKGMAPLELSSFSSLTQGNLLVFSGYHPGNEITEIETIEDLPSKGRSQ